MAILHQYNHMTDIVGYVNRVSVDAVSITVAHRWPTNNRRYVTTIMTDYYYLYNYPSFIGSNTAITMLTNIIEYLPIRWHVGKFTPPIHTFLLPTSPRDLVYSFILVHQVLRCRAGNCL